MLFNSIDFLIFFPIVVFVYYLIPDKIRYIWLLIVSYYFYMNWNAKYALLLLGTTGVTFVCGYLIEACNRWWKEETKTTFWKKVVLISCLVANLGILFVFKYNNFFIENVNALLSRANICLVVPEYDLLLPVGISFYTFQALSYTIDVYRGEIYAEKNFLRYALFVSFFPQLVAGPIERSKHLLSQLRKKVEWNTIWVKEGLLLMLWGYFLKVIIADRAAIIVDCVYGDINTYGGWYLIIATILFAIQIYCDFAGYSTIAMGAAKILGIDLMENFDAPYLCDSVALFWRRWHISLNNWFRDYIYIPLGGNRKGRIRKYINIMIVFLLSGLWHGASWTFVVWGGLNGVYQIIGDILKPIKKRICKFFGIGEDKFGTRVVRIIVTFVLVDFAWIFFRAESLQQAFNVVGEIVTAKNIGIVFDSSLYGLGLQRYDVWILYISIIILMLADLVKDRGIVIRSKIIEQDTWFQWGIIFLAFWGILLFGVYGMEYDVSQFIYFQF